VTLPESPILALVTSLSRLGDPKDPGTADRLVQRIRSAASTGVNLVQVRARSLDGGALQHLVARVLGAVEGTGCRVVVNDRIDVALAAGAHGVHLRADSVPAARARRLVPRGLLGRSIHSEAEAAAAAREAVVDYLVFGTVFPTTSKPADHAAAGPIALAKAVRAAGGIPVVAIGGLTVDNVAEAAAAGASGLAAIGLFLDPATDHDRLSDTLRQARNAFQTASAGADR
jgi:thiamine-phosphate pyrophosphorylase